jgi:pimeloyl-ACP methyl ester carboxylesterase
VDDEAAVGRAHTFDGASHMPHLSEPARYSTTVQSFVATHSMTER